MTARMKMHESDAVYIRAAGLTDAYPCEIGAAQGCVGRIEQLHHRQPRGMGGTSDPDAHHCTNLLGICQPCHSYVESHRAESYRNGWLVRRPSIPADVAVVLADGRRVMLTDDGGYGDLPQGDAWDEFGHGNEGNAA